MALLQTWDDCIENIHLFTLPDDPSPTRMTVNKSGDMVIFFEWIQDNTRHRIDGPALITNSIGNTWWFLGEALAASNQKEFDEWLANNA